MTKIHINSFLGNEEPLDINSLPEGFEDCAARLEKIANEYRAMAAYFREKDIKVIATNGYPHCGSFTVDEIDTQRLKQAGKVIDFADNPLEKSPLFSIDSELDRVLDEMDSTSYVDEIIDRAEEERDEEELEQVFQRVDEANEDDESYNSTYDLANLMLSQKEVPEFEDAPGTINLEAFKISENEYVFELHVQDLGHELPLIEFDRENGIFEYYCGACDTKHRRSLHAVHHSLVKTYALLSNFAYMARRSKEFCMALTTLDDDLRLLAHLVSFDYALDDSAQSE